MFVVVLLPAARVVVGVVIGESHIVSQGGMLLLLLSALVVVDDHDDVDVVVELSYSMDFGAKEKRKMEVDDDVVGVVAMSFSMIFPAKEGNKDQLVMLMVMLDEKEGVMMRKRKEKKGNNPIMSLPTTHRTIVTDCTTRLLVPLHPTL